MVKIKLSLIVFCFLFFSCQKKQKINVKAINIIEINSRTSFNFRKQILISEFKKKKNIDTIKLSNSDIISIEKMIIDDELYNLKGNINSSGSNIISCINCDNNFEIFYNNKKISCLNIKPDFGDGVFKKTPEFDKLNHFRNHFYLILQKYKIYNKRINEYNLYYELDFKTRQKK